MSRASAWVEQAQADWAARVNKRGKQPRGLLKTRLSVTRNTPKERLWVGIVTESLEHAHLPENIGCPGGAGNQ